LRRLRDPHVLSVAAVFKDGDDYCWQLPYFRGGNLEQWLRTNRVGTRDRAVAQRIMNDVLKGLKHLHEKDFVHGDIKPSNILLSQDGRAVLSDFDGIRDVDASASQTYWAPELKSGKAKRFTQATDVFAVGFIAQEVFEG
ncbi:kinase-like domain-containing protein, partial [Hyaloraphidium curvatum]